MRVFTLFLLFGALALCVGWYSRPLARLAAPVLSLPLESGAVDLPAGAAHEHARQPAPTSIVLEKDGWLHGFRIELVDGQGRVVPGELLHHVKVMNRAQRELFEPIMLRVIGAGSETRKVDLPKALGYPLRRGDTLLVTAMLHNPTATSYRQVRVRVLAQYTPNSAPPTPETVYPFFAHVTTADSNSSYDLPPGLSQRSRLLQPKIGGRVIGLGGHLHKFGVRLMLEDVTAGKVLWTSEAVRDSAGNVLEVPTRLFLWRGGLRIQSDHVYRLTGVYLNPTADTLRNAGMSTMGGALQPDARVRWPAPDPAHPIYRNDLARELGTHGGHRH
ncbi:MAG: hypothetical protein ACREMA_07585 [Longimicrobiales bacterium]